MAGKTKGLVIRSRLNFVKDRFGESELKRIIDSLSIEDQRILRGIILPTSWYPAGTNARLDTAIIATIGGRSEQAFWDLGRASATTNLEGLHKNFIREKDPMRFMGKTPAIYRLYYGTGSRTFEATGETSGTITTIGAEDVTEGDCLTVMGWYERALELVLATDIEIKHPTCRGAGGDLCRYEVSWS